MKNCSSCGESKTVDEFRSQGSQCRPCRNRKAAERMDALRRARGIPTIEEMERPWLHKGMKWGGKKALGEDGFRNCSGCGERKHKSQYHQSKKRAGGGITGICKPCALKKNKEYRDKKGRALRLRRYGMTIVEYDMLLAAQGGACAICRSKEPRGNGRFCVDHDHKTGLVRGLLCAPCNWGLGSFRDNVEVMGSAIDYLRANQSSPAQPAGEGPATPERRST